MRAIQRQSLASPTCRNLTSAARRLRGCLAGGLISGRLNCSHRRPRCLGDYSQNGVVDAADYVLWRKTLGTTGVTHYSGADGDGDGDITSGDYDVWRTDFGAALSGLVSSVSVANPAGGSASAVVLSSESMSAVDRSDGFLANDAAAVRQLSAPVHEATFAAIGAGPAAESMSRSSLAVPLTTRTMPLHNDDLLLLALDNAAAPSVAFDELLGGHESDNTPDSPSDALAEDPYLAVNLMAWR